MDHSVVGASSSLCTVMSLHHASDRMQLRKYVHSVRNNDESRAKSHRVVNSSVLQPISIPGRVVAYIVVYECPSAALRFKKVFDRSSVKLRTS